MPDGANHVAFAYSADGKDRFTTVYPNLNLLDGTKDFSGAWSNKENWYKNGTYEGLTVMSFNTGNNVGLTKAFRIPSDGIYSISVLVKVKAGSIGRLVVESAGKPAKIIEVPDTGGKFITKSYTGNFNSGTASMFFSFKYDTPAVKNGVSVAGYKVEHGSTVTPYMPSFSEVTAEDYPSYIGTYTDNDSNTQSTNPEKYSWKKIE